MKQLRTVPPRIFLYLSGFSCVSFCLIKPPAVHILPFAIFVKIAKPIYPYVDIRRRNLFFTGRTRLAPLSYHKSGSSYKLSKEGFPRLFLGVIKVLSPGLNSVQIFPLNQSAILVHNTEIVVRVLINPCPKLIFSNVIVPGGFYNGQWISAPNRNSSSTLSG